MTKTGPNCDAIPTCRGVCPRLGVVWFVVVLSITCVSLSQAQDWFDSFSGPIRTLERAGDQDPRDNRTTLRGRGRITIGQGVARMRQSTRLYVTNPLELWNDVEMTGYARMVNTGNTTNRNAGFTMAARSNHDVFEIDGCQAFGYYARIVLLTGECLFTKEYFHGSNSSLYAPSRRVPCSSPPRRADGPTAR